MDHKSTQIDDRFRERLHDASVAPPAFVWDNIESTLRKRRKKFFFWMFFAGIASVGALGIWLNNTYFSSNDQPALAQVTQHQNELASKQATAFKQAAPVPTKIITATETSQAYTAAASYNPANTPIKPTKNTKTDHATPVVLALTSIPATTTVATPTLTPPLNAEPQKTILAPGEHQQGFRLDMLAALPSVLTSPEQLFSAKDPIKQTWPKPLISTAKKAKAKKAVKNCYDFSKQPAAWMIEAYAGPDLAQRSLVTSYDNQPYLNKRLSTEKRNFAFNGGLRASVMLKGNFLIRTGLHYDQAVEVFEYIDPDEVITEVRNVYDPVTGLTRLDTVGIYYGEKYQKTYNRYGMLDIPLTLGMELRKGRSGLNINAGMSFNVLFWKRGAILSPTADAPVWFSPGKANALAVFKDRAGISAMASVQWFYHLNPRLRVFIEPSFRKVLRPVSLPQHPVQQSYGFGSLRLGFGKILN